MGTRRRFTVEFRRDAAGQVIDTGRPISHVAQELGLVEQTLGVWVKKERQRRKAEKKGVPSVEEQAREIARLGREVARLQRENDFLEKQAPSSPPGIQTGKV
ncbi:MAG: transposase [Arcanobacterium sp.]